MIRKIEISIPEPCHENWLEMSPTEKGKFCSSCQKNVIDFTKSSDRQVLLAYNENEKLCGRFNISQLNRKMIIPQEKKSIWMIAAASIFAFLGLGNQTAKAQDKVKMEQTDHKQLNDSIPLKSPEIKKYSGVVFDHNGLPTPGINITIKGTQISTVTDFDGKFSIEAQKNNILVFKYIGLKTLEYPLNKKLSLSIKMEGDQQELQGFVFIKKTDED